MLLNKKIIIILLSCSLLTGCFIGYNYFPFIVSPSYTGSPQNDSIIAPETSVLVTPPHQPLINAAIPPANVKKPVAKKVPLKKTQPPQSKALKVAPGPTKKKENSSSAILAPTIIKKDPLSWNWELIDTNQLYFPTGFLWGVATSAHQIEGNCTNNDWAVWEQNQKNYVKTGKACDHWNRYQEDILLMKKLGINTYRFSLEWSKIEPQPGHFDQQVLHHYQMICKELIKHGIKPVVTLHHFTNPQWFAQLGGFEKAENIKHFVNYCVKAFSHLNPYVSLWITFNSPTSYVARAYHAQMAPPGTKNMQLMQEALKNILEAHVQVYHSFKKLPGAQKNVGICHNIYQVEPKNFWDSAACSTAYHLFNDNVYQFFKTGIFKASVPFKVNVKHVNKLAIRSLDFIGLNYYSHGQMVNFDVVRHPGDITTQNKIYTIYPEGLYRALMEITNELAKPLNIPIYITENGIATNNEEHRKLFFERYLYALSYAISLGCPVKGYIVWSLLDNYEWGAYDTQFGMYAVDFKTCERSKEPRKGAKPFLDAVKKFS